MRHENKRVLAEGDMLVTGRGEIVLDETIPYDPELTVSVDFDEEQIPPCVGVSDHDVLDWEMALTHHAGHGDVFKLKINWHVSSARVVSWRVTSP